MSGVGVKLPVDFPAWVQEVNDRLRKLEGRNSMAFGPWSVRSDGTNLLAVYVPTGEVHTLVAPDPPPEP